ncbi:hypothetical protein [Paracoccus versutus]|uniref:hypothetical protein n=1 Tax=Paracoccus versutus TaxID=34007 RepID=UPI0011C071DC|nr:hypothetical protein [Paracoccus versutus]
MLTICIWRAVSLCSFVPDLSLFELVALWAALPAAFLVFCLLVLCFLYFLSRGNEVGGGRCPPQGTLFLDF